MLNCTAGLCINSTLERLQGVQKGEDIACWALLAPDKDYTELPGSKHSESFSFIHLSVSALSLRNRSADISNHLICRKLAQVYKWLSRWFVWVCHKSQIKGVPVKNAPAELDETVELDFFFSVVSFIARKMYTKYTGLSHSLKIAVMSRNIAQKPVYCFASSLTVHSQVVEGY